VLCISRTSFFMLVQLSLTWVDQYPLIIQRITKTNNSEGPEMWLCAVQILLGALEAEDVKLLRREDGLPLLLRLLHGPWRRGRRRHRRHARESPYRRAARRGRRREAPARPRRAREGRGPRARGGRRGGEEEGGERARGARRHGGGAGARVRCHRPQPQQTRDAHVSRQQCDVSRSLPDKVLDSCSGFPWMHDSANAIVP
jgi:hypothetical protein